MNFSEHYCFAIRLSVVGALAVFAGVAHASTATYDLAGVTAGGFALTGTLSVDTTTDFAGECLPLGDYANAA
jgi:hypothetical protein